MTRLLIALLVAGCGGDQSGGGTAPVSPGVAAAQPTTSGGVAATITSINGVTVPIDPGSTGKASLAGVDANGNGVRDEVERELAFLFGQQPNSFAAAMSLARSIQKGFTTPSVQPDDARRRVEEEASSILCLRKTFSTDADADDAVEAVVTRSANTRLRVVERTRSYELSGLLELPNGATTTCL